MKESYERAAIVAFSLIGWAYIVWKGKSYAFAGLITLFLALPFNITYQLPQGIFEYDPYANLIISNYLIPTLSILDIFLLLALIGVLVDFGRSLSRWSVFLVVISLGYLLVHYLLHPEWITFISGVRYLVAVNLIGLALFDKDEIFMKFKKVNEYFIKYLFVWLGLLILLFEVGLGLAQINRGADMGLSFLGESNLMTGIMGVSFWSYSGQDFLRAYGTFPHPNIFAGYLLLAAYLFGQSSFRPFKRADISLIFNVAVYSIIALGIAITLSRSAALAFAVFAFLMLMKFTLEKVNEKKVNLAVIGIPVFMQRLSPSNIQDESFEDRLKLSQAAISGIKENWLVGTGIGRSVEIYEKIKLQTTGGFTLNQPVHNIFLLLILENGLFAGVATILFMIAFWGYSLLRSKDFYYTVSIISSILIIGLLDHYLLTLPQGITIFLFMNLSLVYLTISRKS
ncbi:MAG: O-antigen ligase family protein [Candidatus Dojkabacteria bacterium]|nr:MAG: O-antigen ligase family protein [Candidatus Dojkabacteria bacterium]